jgi:hypothetical protein
MLAASGKLLSLVRILKQVDGRLKKLVKHIIKLLSALKHHTLTLRNHQLILSSTFLAIRDFYFQFYAESWSVYTWPLLQYHLSPGILYKHKSINTFEGSIIIMSTLMDMTVEIGQVEPEPEEPGDVEPEPAPEPGQAKETEDDSQ